jgi:hypothetical protein
LDTAGEDDHDELRKALTLSLGGVANGAPVPVPVFGPNRDGEDQNWAVVPLLQDGQVGGSTDGKAHEAELQRAMEASMTFTREVGLDLLDRPRGNNNRFVASHSVYTVMAYLDVSRFTSL